MEILKNYAGVCIKIYKSIKKYFKKLCCVRKTQKLGHYYYFPND
jgi:hypothetical protein